MLFTSDSNANDVMVVYNLVLSCVFRSLLSALLHHRWHDVASSD